MSLQIFNVALLASWLLVTLGGCLLNIGGGLIGGGLLLLAITLFVAKLGGIYQAEKEQGAD